MKLRDKRFRYGMFSTVMMLLAVMLFIIVNLVASGFNITRDLTREQVFTLTDRSIEFLAELNSPVTIYYLVPTGHEHVIISQLLEEYAAASTYIRVELRDPTINPVLAHQLAAEARLAGGIPIGSTGSIVVQSATGTVAVTELDMLPRNAAGEITSMNFEPSITRAIHNVSQGVPPVVYFVYGSGEIDISIPFIGYLLAENFALRSINLVENHIPDDADILFITMPSRDWTAAKRDRIEAFLTGGGRAFMALNLRNEATPSFDNMLASFGIAVGNFLVLEGDSRQYIDNPSIIIPTQQNHPALNNLYHSDFVNILPVTTALEILDMRRPATNITPVWTTSFSSFGRHDPNETSPERIPSDSDGPFNLALAITERIGENETQFIAVSSLTLISDDVTPFVGESNWLFVADSLRWLHGQPSGIFIPRRNPPGMNPLIVPGFQANIFRAIAMGGLPAVTLIIGVIVYVKRKNN
ncbi:MAG: GldG family protein [Defluviitaleaceae bacterium]|nr:GldG family protein [Defluviitaleaceae bacterium]